MFKRVQLCLVFAFFALVLNGCAVRTYNLTRDRIDQNLESGNRGYLIGKMPAEEANKERKLTRTTRIVEVEMYSPIKSGSPYEKKAPRTRVAPEPRIQEDYSSTYTPQPYVPRIESTEPVAEVASQKYTVQKGDTLQKISQKFYGTTKKWYSIYKANQDTLKSPNSIYPGQVINIPGASSAQTEAPVSGLK